MNFNISTKVLLSKKVTSLSLAHFYLLLQIFITTLIVGECSMKYTYLPIHLPFVEHLVCFQFLAIIKGDMMSQSLQKISLLQLFCISLGEIPRNFIIGPIVFQIAMNQFTRIPEWMKISISPTLVIC